MANKVYIGLLLLILLILALSGGVWFLQNFERFSEEIRTGYSSAARRNPWLAAERFLQRLGMQVESLAGREYLLAPPQESGVLLVRDLGPSLPPEREARLLEWVAAGGHLIIAMGRAPAEDEANNHLLEHLGVFLEELELPDSTENSEPVPVESPGFEDSMLVTFDPSRSLSLDETTADWLVEASVGYHLVRFRYANGSITLLSDNRFLSNSEIDKHDHALLLARLVADAPRGWLLYSSQMPSLLTWIWKHAPYLALSVAVTLLLWLWRLTPRTGPLLAENLTQRRDLLEHLQAATEFLWRQDRASALQRRIRRCLEGRWLRSHPQLERMDQTARCAWLAQRTGLATDAIEQALYHQQTDERELIRASAILQRLNTALNPNISMEQTDGRNRNPASLRSDS